jgi:single-stranded-DNA-specific exonuclease
MGARLVLTCDCGVRAHHAVDALNAAGLEVVITDHHEPGDRLPNALAVVNPKRADSQYPFRDLSGVGVSFRVAEALLPSATSLETASMTRCWIWSPSARSPM